MIIKSKLSEESVYTLPYYNTYRPDIFDEEDVRFWSEMHTYIKECEYPIIVNSSFGFVDNILETNTRYGGGGFNYCFWFYDEEDKDEFRNHFIGKLKEYGWRIGSWL